MNAPHKNHAPYGRMQTAVKAPRQVEYDLFAKITQQLTQSAKTRDTDYPRFAKAVHDNITLWQTLAMDVASSGNGLPAPLRAQIFYLYEATALHSKRILDRNTPITILVDINTSIMRGLRGETAIP